jgi:hypothetical protein
MQNDEVPELSISFDDFGWLEYRRDDVRMGTPPAIMVVDHRRWDRCQYGDSLSV